MVDQQLGIDTEQLVEQIFIVKRVRLADRAAGNIAHGVQSDLSELFGVAATDTPEIGQRLMIPKQLAITYLVERGDADTVRVRGNMLGADIHGDLRQIQIGADACRRGDTGFAQNLEDHFHSQFPRVQPIQRKIICGVDKDFIDRIDMDILGRDIPKIDAVDAGACVNVVRHAWTGGDIGDREFRMRCQFSCICRLTCKALPAGAGQPQGVQLADFLDDFKEPRPSGDAVGTQARRDRQADGFFGAGSIGDDQMRGQRV